MKKIMILFAFIAISITVMAESPKLASVKIFDEIDYYDPSLTVMIVEKKDKTVKSVSFKNNADLQKKILKAVTTDRQKADSKSFSSSNGETSEYLDIVTDNEKIKIGFTQTKSKEVYFFVNILSKTQQTSGSGKSNRTQKTRSTKSNNTKSKRTRTRTTKSSGRTVYSYQTYDEYGCPIEVIDIVDI